MLTAVQAVGLSLCPETPVWLEWKGKSEEALKAKERLQGPAATWAANGNHADDADQAETGIGHDTEVQQPLRGESERRHSDGGSSYQVSQWRTAQSSFSKTHVLHIVQRV